MAYDLLEQNKTILGTIRPNKREIPEEFKANRHRDALNTVYGFNGDLTLMSYVPKKASPPKAVIMLSTFHHQKDLPPEPDIFNLNQQSTQTFKPEMILDYNKWMGAIDNVDQKIGNYSSKRAVYRWPLRLFQNFLDISGVNAHIIYNIKNGTKVSRYDFLNSLAMSLCEFTIKNRSKFLPNNLKENVNLVSSYINQSNFPAAQNLDKQLMEPTISTDSKNRSKGQCVSCEKRSESTIKCDMCYSFVCKSHRTNLCVNCFDKIRKNFDTLNVRS